MSRGAVAVLGYTLWRSRFNGDPSVVGRTLTLDGQRVHDQRTDEATVLQATVPWPDWPASPGGAA